MEIDSLPSNPFAAIDLWEVVGACGYLPIHGEVSLCHHLLWVCGYDGYGIYGKLFFKEFPKSSNSYILLASSVSFGGGVRYIPF